jgi:hypothetical protein
MMFGLLCILLALVAAFDFKALLIPAAFGILASMYFLYILPGLLYIGRNELNIFNARKQRSCHVVIRR